MATSKRANPVKSKEEKEKLAAQLTQIIEDLDAKIAELNKEQEPFLQNTYVSQRVQHPAFGEGVITGQQEDMITVSFSKDGLTKSFLIHRKYTSRPTFEKDEEAVTAFSDFADRKVTINQMKQERIRLENQRAALLQN
ncbi:MAG: hypothetical protein IJN67_12450 [Oscillospiraceae bacterium]|nr:hypothetical protein [Oscillospiraceae bacterium]